MAPLADRPSVGPRSELTSDLEPTARQLVKCQVVAAINRATSVLILGHVHPDADALGSALGLGLALEQLGRVVTVSFGSPAFTPVSLQQLPGQHLIRTAAEVPPVVDLVISVDAGSTERLGRLAPHFDRAAESICIDHHATNAGFGGIQFIDPGVNATVCLIMEILDELGVELTSDIAKNLYAGLATDTGNFRFASAQDHQLCARLLATRIVPEEVTRPIMDVHPFGWLGMLSTVLGHAVLDRDAVGGSGLVAVSIGLAAASGLGQEELDSVIDIIRTTNEAEVAAVLKETKPGHWQVSLRGKTVANVAAAAAMLGGGGHPRAAGYGTVGTAGEVLAELVQALDTAIVQD